MATRQKLMRRIAWAVAILAACVVIWPAVIAVRSADHAERALHACILMTDVLEAYVISTAGKWPESWDDMQSTVPSFGSQTMYSWPGDRREIETFVEIDFASRPADLAAASPDDFKAIKPIGACFTTYGRNFPVLIDALRRSRPVKSVAPNPDRTRESK